LKKDPFLSALACQNSGRKPVWIMRQAGRFLPEYRAIREKHTLSEMFFDPELVVKTTLLPIDIISTDAAILFSDILIVAKALGLDLTFEEGRGPVVTPLIRRDEDITSLKSIDVRESLAFTAKSVRELKKQLKVPLIGFCGGPFTVASYLLEEKHTHDLHATKKWLYQNPKSLHLLLQKITDVSISYIEMLIESGIDAVQIFDSFAHVLSSPLLKEFALSYVNQIAAFVKKKNLPVIVFMRGACLFAEELIELKPTAISFDWQKKISELRKVVPSAIALQGNFDPHLLFSSKETIRKTVLETLASMKNDTGYIVNLGHGILPQTEVEKARYFVELINEHS
jgi:uroporphyrinogen decarboxylase